MASTPMARRLSMHASAGGSACGSRFCLTRRIDCAHRPSIRSTGGTTGS
ncbi:Uncharacterised protein [Bordetella pertussis]|nr:Uncharacterised protein [Bordetella pertussis]